MMTRQNVLIVGSWHLGSVIGACLADAGQNVFLWDQNPKVAERWQSGKPPIHEPGLEDLAARHWGKHLQWVQNPSDVGRQIHWIVLSYDTPINDQDELILTSVEEGFQTALKSGFGPTTNFFVTSQVPVGTSRRFLEKIRAAQPQWSGHLFYQPENLRLGEAIKSFKTPDRMVLGVDTMSAPQKEELARSFQELLQNTSTPLNVMSLESAEMVKHALNSFLATCVVFANELSEICERTGADGWDVVASLKQDSRVGPKAFLRPGLGFAGGTLARDVKTLSLLMKKSEGTNLFSNLYKINQLRNEWVTRQLASRLGGLAKKKIVLLGITYKPFTSTVRRSPALEIGQLLVRGNASCIALDPMADLDELSPTERQSLPFTLEKSPATAFEGADAAVVVTEWPQFKEFPWSELKKSMKSALILDAKKLFNSGELPEGMTHVIPGKPEEAP